MTRKRGGGLGVRRRERRSVGVKREMGERRRFEGVTKREKGEVSGVPEVS